MADDRDGRISMSRIPVRGGIGAFVLIVILIAAVLGDLPQLRGPFLGGVGLGLMFAVALILWRRRTMDSHKLPPGAHTMFVPESVTAPRERIERERPFTRPGAHPRAVPAS